MPWCDGFRAIASAYQLRHSAAASARLWPASDSSARLWPTHPATPSATTNASVSATAARIVLGDTAAGECEHWSRLGASLWTIGLTQDYQDDAEWTRNTSPTPHNVAAGSHLERFDAC